MDQEVEVYLDDEVNKTYGRCRCCLELGFVKNIWTEYSWDGIKEIYGEMLMETFSIVWDSSLTDKEQICDSCVRRLRDAHMFKREVLASEQLLKEGVLDSEQGSVKEERLSDLDQYENITTHVVGDPDEMEEEPDQDTENEEDAKYKEETCEEEEMYEEVEYLDEDILPDMQDTEDVGESSKNAKSSKGRRKRVKGLNIRNYKNYSEDTLRESVEVALNSDKPISEVAAMYGVPRKTLTARVYNIRNRTKPDDPGTRVRKSSRIKRQMPCDSNAETTPPGSDTQDDDGKSYTETVLANLYPKREVEKHRENVKTILTYSNATPFKNQGSGYNCIYCDKVFPALDKLKIHALTHTDISKAYNFKLTYQFTLKLDITGLKCLVCGMDIVSLEYLMTHLKKHGKVINLDIKNQIIPFKFHPKKFKCALCDKVFGYFKILSEHMSSHYSNYECNQCHRWFINQSSLKAHKERHKLGEYACAVCSKVFVSKIRRRDHERSVHTKLGKSHKCYICDTWFPDGVHKARHEVEYHGATPRTFDCNACTKKFETQRSLRLHVNAYHLLRKRCGNLKCAECGMEFNRKRKLDKHMAKHTGIKDIACPLCDKTFGHQDYLASHIKRHNQERRFKCDLCPKMFRYKLSLRGHLKNIHDKHSE